jgi:hypothetical protein
MVSPVRHTSWPLSGRNSTYPAVQISRASSYVRGAVHANSAEGFNDRVRRTIAGVFFHHISPEHANFYFHEVGFRWAQQTVAGQAERRTRKGRTVVRTLWARTVPAVQLRAVFRHAVGRQRRRTGNGGFKLVSKTALFG